jgi:predicted metal-binding membrane protein
MAPASARIAHGVPALLFAVSAAVTIAWCGPMAMGGMPMPGGWTMSMAWMRMPGQTWFSAAVAFLGMWSVMMMAMMLPVLTPMLWRYRRAAGPMAGPRAKMRLGRLTTLVALAYFSVWTLLGLAAFPLGVALATLEMHLPVLARAVPAASGVMVLIAGASQFTPWKARRLACCRETAGCERAPNQATALRHGLRLGLHCVACCAPLTAILCAIGVMDLWAMAAVTMAITAERLAPRGRSVARITGAVAMGAGAVLILRAVGLG